MTEELTIRDKYDALLHLHDEMQMEEGEMVPAIQKLFPAFNNIGVYDAILGNYEIEVFANSRALGLSVEDSAHSAEVSHTVMRNALEGKGLTAARFVRLVKSELFAVAQLIAKLLNTIEKAESNTSVSAAVALLEKIAPQKYGKNADLGLGNQDDKRVTINFSVREEDS